MTKHYTNAPEPTPEDYLLPYFLKDDEKYVELMAAVHELLRAFPENMTRDHLARLNEAYHQILHGPHPYESIPENRGLSSTLSPSNAAWYRPYTCNWCGKGVHSHP